MNSGHCDRVPAVVYLRTELSGAAQRLDEYRMRRLAVRFGYEVCAVLRFDATRSRRLELLEDRIRMHRAEAVFVPTIDHLGGQLGRIVAQADVIEQCGRTYARWAPIAVVLDDAALAQLISRSGERGRGGP